ncbi:AHH domain-containing protein [Algoriphagus sp.]|uniref:AHH domain-containing protein n=1 Tax=Algoriphagus sp. TaxID=1872435 RepID=UPI00260FED8A|nr:AHH domain-containing protein [Algoriphagus sp.]
MSKRVGVDIIQSARNREMSDFLFDLDASLLTQDSLLRKTYTVPFLEKDDRFSTFNLVVVTDSLDNLLDQYVLKYEFDSLQYQSFLELKDLLQSGAIIKRYSFSNFFNDSNPTFLERCQGVFDENGDPVICDQVTIESGSGGGGSTGGSGDAWITPGGGSTPESGGGSSGSGSSGGGTSCSWTISYQSTETGIGGSYCESVCSFTTIITITCADPYSRKRVAENEGAMTCMDCDVSDFGTPAFTPSKISNSINRDLNGALSDYHLQYLSHPDNQTFAKDLWQALGEDEMIDQNAALFTISAGMNGVLDKPFNSTFGLAVDGLVEADLSNPATLHLFYTYFSAKIAFLKHEHPEWSDGKLLYEATKEALHWTLDIAGLVPVLGEPADLLNATLYLIEGDGVNATISAASAIPFYGIIASGSRMGWKVISSTSDIPSKRILRWVVNLEGKITFGYRSDLAKNFPSMNSATHQAHHIIPWSKKIQEHPVVQKAADWGFHMNESLNGIPVTKARNQPNHDVYNDLIESKLDFIERRFPEDQWNNELVKLVNDAKAAIQANPSKHLNDITF